MRKVIGAVKDQTTIGIAKVSSAMAPELDVAVVKATGHDDDPADEKYFQEILSMTSYSGGYIDACITAISRRLSRTKDWIIVLKCLTLVHRLLRDGHPSFQQEFLYATRKGTRLLNLSDFRDEAHSHSWDHSAFVRTYALYLDQRLECNLYEKKQGSSRGTHPDEQRNGSTPRRQEEFRDEQRYGSTPHRREDYGDEQRYGSTPYRREDYRDEQRYGSMPRRYEDNRYEDQYGERNKSSAVVEKKQATPVRDMDPGRAIGRIHHLQLLLDRFLACRPTGLAKNSRMILISLYPIVRESFQIYADICEVLALLVDKFFDMEYADCSRSFEAYCRAAKQIEELASFFSWCKETGIARSSEYPEVQLISPKLLDTLQEFIVERARGQTKIPEPDPEPEPVPAPAPETTEIKALPAPEIASVEVPLETEPPPQVAGDLVDLREESNSGDENRLALALFSGDGKWEAFSGGSEVTSAWQNPAADKDNSDWELVLVESASNLANQKPAMAGGLDPLLLEGMYDSGTVRQHVGMQASIGGSASSVAAQPRAVVLALPAPDGTVQPVNQDPFAASLAVPPPSYVQMAEMEKKQALLVQENHLWQQYAREGMQGQTSLAKLSAAPQYYYGMPAYGPPYASYAPY